MAQNNLATVLSRLGRTDEALPLRIKTLAAQRQVLGVDHPELGQEVMAVVVTAPDAEVDVETLSAWTAETLAYYKVPSRWELRTEALPRNASGKVMKWLLQQGVESPLIPEK